jgi:hypothetical protein
VHSVDKLCGVPMEKVYNSLFLILFFITAQVSILVRLAGEREGCRKLKFVERRYVKNSGN